MSESLPPAASSWIDRVPLPTSRMLGLFGAAAAPTLLTALEPRAGEVALGLVALVALAFAVDAARLSRARLAGRRTAPEVMRAFAENPMRLELHNPGPVRVAGRWFDAHAQKPDSGDFALAPGERLELELTCVPGARGPASFADVRVDLAAPWALATRRLAIAGRGTARVYPDLREPGDALLLARPRQDGGLSRLRRLGEGRELDALRLYREGDDLRAVDWKASARRGALVTREYVPEKNQAVVLLVDCGRHFVARERGRSRLDFSIEAALRLARASLERGDAVGVLAFGAAVRAWVPPSKGPGQLRALTEAVYALAPELEESDYGAAFDQLGRAITRRALVVTFTDLVDADASRVLLARTAALRPRHLPVLVMLLDAELARLQSESPADGETAFARSAAVRLLRARSAAVARLRELGAMVVSARSDALSAAAIDAYLRIKERGLL